MFAILFVKHSRKYESTTRIYHLEARPRYVFYW